MAALLVAQAVAQAHQAVAQVNVLHYHFGVGNGEVVVGEVPEALNAQVHQPSADLLCTIAGYAEHRHLGLVFLTEGFQLVNVTDADTADLLAHLVLGHVNGRDQLVAVGIGGDKAAHRLAQTAAADQNGGQTVTVAEQQTFQNGKQVLHRVADALTAIHVADAVEVLPHLRGSGTHLGGQLTGRDAGDAVVLQGAQVAIVFGQALDDGQRSFAGSVPRGAPFFLSAALPGRGAQRQGAPAKDLYFLVQ